LNGIEIHRRIEFWNSIPFVRAFPDWMKGLYFVEYYKSIFNKWINKVAQSAGTKQENLSLINLISSAKDEETATTLTYQEIVDNVKIFYFAAYETTSTLLSYCFYFFMKYPETFKKVQDEVDFVVGDNKQITLENIEKLVYLQCFIKETLRLKAPIGFLNRMPPEDIQAGKYTFPKETIIVILIDAINTDKNYWDKADEFLPERWLNLDETKLKTETHYIPFSTGPRICIGQRLAREEATVLLILIAKYFNVKAAESVVSDPIIDYGKSNFRPKILNTVFTRRDIKQP